MSSLFLILVWSTIIARFIIFLILLLGGVVAYWEFYVNRRNGLTRAMAYTFTSLSGVIFFSLMLGIRFVTSASETVQVIIAACMTISCLACLHSFIGIAREIQLGNDKSE